MDVFKKHRWLHFLEAKMRKDYSFDHLEKETSAFMSTSKHMDLSMKQGILSIAGDGNCLAMCAPVVCSLYMNEMYEQSRADISARPRLTLGRAVASHIRKQTNSLPVIHSFHSYIFQSRNGDSFLCSGIFAFKTTRSL